MTRPVQLKKISILLLTFFCVFPIFAETVTDQDYGYSLDLPEGYEIKDYSEDGTSYFLQHPNIPVSLIMKVVKDDKGTSNTVLKNQMNKLNAKTDLDNFDWNRTKCSVGKFSMVLDQSYAGWSVCAPLQVKGYYLTLICYAPKEKEPGCEQFIFSTLNSLSTDMENYNTPGIIVTYAFPKEGTKSITLDINGNKVYTFIDKSDEEASQWIVDMEYAVLTLYGKHNMWKEAWQRYYRMIYRDSFGRLENVSADIYDALWFNIKSKNPKNPEIAYAQELLSWVQNFDYYRGEKSSDSDFTSLPRMLAGTGNDCDSRSLLICMLLKTLGIESIMIFSPQYSHAMACTLIEAPGQTFKLPGTNLEFIMGETTAHVTWGMISKEHSDRSKWIEVLLP